MTDLEARPATTRLSIRLSDELDERLDDIVGTGYFLNRSEAARAGARNALDFDGELRSVNEHWGRNAGPRMVIRIPEQLDQEVERVADDHDLSQAAIVRKGIQLLAREYLEVVDSRRYFA